MKQSALLIFLLTFCVGCNLLDSESTELIVRDIEVVEVKLIPGEEYVYNLGSLGDEEQASIKEDSQFATVSDLFYDFEGAVFVKYKYQSQPTFSGKDKVVLEIRRGSDGEAKNSELYYTVLHFNIKKSS